ncbi:hypothetical protein Ahy_Scaffold6g108250 [Arachis hypogaea]|uniref:SWIM-type domain-containing protein n=1 Tax=Arachis hypogaea TaxID=3818 RepID=A0A444WPZ9_ARAHY|nr:hypothetical protein Ahy_Scaffold6g108250 [Arachis hypogaea]
MLSIAYVVMEAETKNSWKWFLLNLIDDSHIGKDKLLRSTFIFCVRHLYVNFKKKTSGLNLKKRIIGLNQGLKFYPECDAFVNNLCGSFNSAIVESRQKSILTMLEDIQAENKELIEKYKDDILPRNKVKLQKKKINASRWWFLVAARISKFEVIRGRDKFIVDPMKKECTCRKFQTTSLPCPHTDSAINCAKNDIRKYVTSCYTKTVYVAFYTL